MDSWLQWSSLLAPQPNLRHFSGKKAKKFYRLTAPMSSLSTDTQRKRKIKKLRRSFSPPPKIQSFCFESEPILDVASPDPFTPLPRSMTDEANRGAYVNSYPKIEDPVSFTKGTYVHYSNLISLSRPFYCHTDLCFHLPRSLQYMSTLHPKFPAKHRLYFPWERASSKHKSQSTHVY